jgi:RHS repeat-associated protein
VLGHRFSHKYGYNFDGQVEQLQYPMAIAAPLDVDQQAGLRRRLELWVGYHRGFLWQLGDGGAGEAFGSVDPSFGYHPAGGMRKWDLPVSGVAYQWWTYDERGRVLRIGADGPGGALLDTGVYKYDPSGNLYQVGSDRFYYHGDGELASAVVRDVAGVQQNVSYTIDPFGNLAAREGVEPFSAIVDASKNRLTHVDGQGVVYRDSGLLVQDGAGTYFYDSLSRLYDVWPSAGGAVRSLYDAEGRRVSLTTGEGCRAGQHLYLRGMDGKLLSEYFYPADPACSDQLLWLRDHVYRGSEPLAVRDNATLAPPEMQLVVWGSCESKLSAVWIETANPEANACRSGQVNVYRRDAAGSYDYSLPLNEQPLEAACPSRAIVSEPAAVGACYVSRAVHRSGALGPPSAELCIESIPDCAQATIGTLSCPGGTPTQPLIEQRGYVTDHLGTPRLEVRLDGSVARRQKLGPFGEDLGEQACEAPPRFTGHERDPETGLDYMMARYYARCIGRFLTTDPVAGTPGNPQSWNRYTYALNNPMRYTDPHGEAAKEVADEIDETVDNLVELIDDSTSEGFLGTPLNDIAVGLGFMVSGAADMIRVGDATGTVIGTGGDFHDAAMSTSQDVARGSALFVTLGSVAAPLAAGPAKAAALEPSAARAVRSLEGRLAEHRGKLDADRASPEAFDNQGFLKGAPDAATKQRIIDGRIRHLENEIRNFEKQIDALRRRK